MGFGGFSWKRALGITKAKQQLSRKIGIPLTKSGRQRKLGSLFYPKSRKRRSNSGCLVMFILTSLFLLSTYSAIFAGEQIAELAIYSRKRCV